MNASGSFHDSTIADYGAYARFEQLYRTHHAKIVVDSAFQIGTHDWLIQSSQVDPVEGGRTSPKSRSYVSTSVERVGNEDVTSIFPPDERCTPVR